MPGNDELPDLGKDTLSRFGRARQKAERLIRGFIKNDEIAITLQQFGQPVHPLVRPLVAATAAAPGVVVSTLAAMFFPEWLAAVVIAPWIIFYTGAVPYLLYVLAQPYAPSRKSDLLDDTIHALKCRARLAMLAALTSLAIVIAFVGWQYVDSSPNVPALGASIAVALGQPNEVGACVQIDFHSDYFPADAHVLALAFKDGDSGLILADIAQVEDPTHRKGSVCPHAVHLINCEFGFAVVYISPERRAEILRTVVVTGLMIGDGCSLQPEVSQVEIF